MCLRMDGIQEGYKEKYKEEWEYQEIGSWEK